MKTNSQIAITCERNGFITVTTVIGRAAATSTIHLTPTAALRLASQLIEVAGQDNWLEYRIGDPLD